MKSLLNNILPFLFFSVLFFTSCSSSENTTQNKLEFVEIKEINSKNSVYKYKYNFEGSAWMDLSAYVKKETSSFIISINDPVENNLNVYTYFPKRDKENLKITNRVRVETAASLEEAIEKSILFYLADNI